MDGIIPIWKERGMTSHDVVFKARKILKMKKVGHTGTLDPNVDGVLPICVGKGTKMVEFLMDKTKEYVGEITLGFATDTEDLDGEVVETHAITQAFTNNEIDEAMQQLIGDIVQIPPMYSAVRVNGRRLYEYARAGETVERPQRTIRVDSFERMTDIIYNEEEQTQNFRFKVVCGKGTYVRTLAYDLGQKLTVPATMTDLTRTATTPYSQENCVTLAELKEAVENEDFSFLNDLETAINHLPIWQVNDAIVNLINNGAVLNVENLPDELSEQLPVRAYVNGELKAIYDIHPSKAGQMKPMRMF